MTPDPTPGEYQALGGTPDTFALCAAEGLDPNGIRKTWTYHGNGHMTLQIYIRDANGHVQNDPDQPGEPLTRTLEHHATTDIPIDFFGPHPSTQGAV